MAEEENLELNELDPATGAAPENDGGMSADDDGGRPHGASDLEAVYDIPVQVSAVLGKATMQVNQLLKLGRGARRRARPQGRRSD